jgi:hypothetical protein
LAGLVPSAGPAAARSRATAPVPAGRRAARWRWAGPTRAAGRKPVAGPVPAAGPTPVHRPTRRAGRRTWAAPRRSAGLKPGAGRERPAGRNHAHRRQRRTPARRSPARWIPAGPDPARTQVPPSPTGRSPGAHPPSHYLAGPARPPGTCCRSSDAPKATPVGRRPFRRPGGAADRATYFHAGAGQGHQARYELAHSPRISPDSRRARAASSGPGSPIGVRRRTLVM